MTGHDNRFKYLELLSEKFPTAASAAAEIMNLKAILSLPKGTEHFLADVHGEYEAFIHVLKNASGSIKEKVLALFGDQMDENQINSLCTLIYYPRESIILKKNELGIDLDSTSPELDQWFLDTIAKLIKVCRKAGEKYTRSKVRKALPPLYSYIMLELMHENSTDTNKAEYIQSIFKTILESGQAENFIIEFSNTIQRLVIDHLHIVGDIYDRGPGAEVIMDRLLSYHHVDIQWGNHDMLWMGAANGNLACIANVVRISLRYANLDTLENGYAINLLPLSVFARETYADTPLQSFMPKAGKGGSENLDEKQSLLVAMMHKAIAIIQFKLEHQIISRHPEYKMEGRNLLHTLDQEQAPTVSRENPYYLTEEEEKIIADLAMKFKRSERLQRHIDFLYKVGSMYLCCNNNLLFHASVPMNPDRSFREVITPSSIPGKVEYHSGKALYDRIDTIVRQARKEYLAASENKFFKTNIDLSDYFWYLWCGPDSPQFDKSAMTTFERYFNPDKSTHHEEKGCYYTFRTESEVCDKIMQEFGVGGPDAHIINGHVPVKAKDGELPIKADGKLMVIDGGFSRAYQSSTGIAGYTLIFNSKGMHIVRLSPFTSTQSAVANHDDIDSVTVVNSSASHRLKVRDTDNGVQLQKQVDDLTELMNAYRKGEIHEKKNNR